MKKKVMTSSILALSLVAAMAFPAQTLLARGWHKGGHCAYGEPGFHHGQPFRHLDRMQYYLGLSDKQVEQIFRVDQDYREKYFKNRKSFDKIEVLRADHRKAVEAVLNPEQKKKFEDMHKWDRKGPRDREDRRPRRGR